MEVWGCGLELLGVSPGAEMRFWAWHPKPSIEADRSFDLAIGQASTDRSQLDRCFECISGGRCIHPRETTRATRPRAGLPLRLGSDLQRPGHGRWLKRARKPRDRLYVRAWAAWMDLTNPCFECQVSGGERLGCVLCVPPWSSSITTS